MNRRPNRILIAEEKRESKNLPMAILLGAVMKSMGYRVTGYTVGCDPLSARLMEIAIDGPVYALDPFLCGNLGVAGVLELTSEESDICLIFGELDVGSGGDLLDINPLTVRIAQDLSAPILPVFSARGSSVIISKKILKIIETSTQAGIDCFCPAVAFVDVPSVGEYDLMELHLGRQSSLVSAGYLPKNFQLETPTCEELASTNGLRNFSLRLKGIVGTLLHGNQYLDIGLIVAIARNNSLMPKMEDPFEEIVVKKGVQIAVFSSPAYQFHFKANNFCFQRCGMEILSIDPVFDSIPVEAMAVYIPHGYPHVSAGDLSANGKLWSALYAKVVTGMPVWAEGGGMANLGSYLIFKGLSLPVIKLFGYKSTINWELRSDNVDVASRRENMFMLGGANMRGLIPSYMDISEEKVSVTALEIFLARNRGISFDDGWIMNSLMATRTQISLWSNMLSLKRFVQKASSWSKK